MTGNHARKKCTSYDIKTRREIAILIRVIRIMAKTFIIKKKFKYISEIWQKQRQKKNTKIRHQEYENNFRVMKQNTISKKKSLKRKQTCDVEFFE